MGGHSLWELFLKGGIVMWPLLLCSIVAIALILERGVVVLWSSVRFQPLVDWLRQRVQDGSLEQARERLARSRSPVARVAAVYLKQAGGPAALREEVVTREASQQLAALEKRMSWLALLAHVAPLLGLLGTVIGLMAAFQQIDIKGSQVQTTDLAVGIWQKLLNTAFGMIVAIPCLVAYYWLDNRVGVLSQQMEWITSYLNEWLFPAAAATADSAAGSANGSLATKPAPTAEACPSLARAP